MVLPNREERRPEGGDTINKFIPATNTLTVLKSFKRDDTVDGSLPTGRLVLASNGKLYGIAETGGHFSSGVLFSYDPNSLTYIKLLDFESGAIIAGSLMLANNGKLYGMAQVGGNANDGFIFSFDPVSATYSKLLDFNFTNGANPLGSLMQASDGKLYGMTSGGGNIGEGVIFSVDPSTGAFTKLLDLDGTNGAIPQGSLIQASDGKLYGMTMRFGSGGAIVGEGVIFLLTHLPLLIKRLSSWMILQALILMAILCRQRMVNYMDSLLTEVRAMQVLFFPLILLRLLIPG